MLLLLIAKGEFVEGIIHHMRARLLHALLCRRRLNFPSHRWITHIRN